MMALGISGLICLISLIFTKVSWQQFWWQAGGIFVFFLVDYIYNWSRTIILMKKDPVFKTMTEHTGISWKDYKRLKNK